MYIRDKRSKDAQTICDLTAAAFKVMPYSAGHEQIWFTSDAMMAR